MGEFNSQKFVFTFEKIGRENLSGADCYAFGESVEKVIVDSFRDCSGDMQPPMPILPSAIMEVPQSIVQSTLRITERFFSTVRLYSREPSPQLLREWKLVNTCRFEFLGTGINRKFEAVCVGGRFASLNDPNSFPYKSIQGGAELIEILAEFERQQLVIRGHLEDGCSDPCPLVFLVKVDGIAVLWKDPENFTPKSFGMHFGSRETLPTVFE